MQPSGLAAFELRRAERTGTYSFEQPTPTALSKEQEAILRADPAAAAFWDAATAGYRRLATHWVLSAKKEATRIRRLAQLVQDSAAGRPIPSQRHGTPASWQTRAAAAARAASKD